jgi:hypothetical protein
MVLADPPHRALVSSTLVLYHMQLSQTTGTRTVGSQPRLQARRHQVGYPGAEGVAGMNVPIVSFGLLLLAVMGLLCSWRGRQLLHEASINLDARGSAGCFFVMTALLFSATITGIALLVMSH